MRTPRNDYMNSVIAKAESYMAAHPENFPEHIPEKEKMVILADMGKRGAASARRRALQRKTGTKSRRTPKGRGKIPQKA